MAPPLPPPFLDAARTDRPASRRLALGAALATFAGATTAGSAADAASGSSKKRGKKDGAVLLSRSERHLVSRFSYGVTPKLARQVRRAGGGESWFDQQLALSRKKDKKVKKFRRWWPSLDRSPGDLWARQIQEIEPGGVVMRNYQRWVLMRRTYSDHQLAEVMTEFWLNHFNVPAVGDAAFTHRVDFDDTIRKNALGSFEKLLLKADTHPAMLIYLNAVESTKSHPNENLGRELLELHTVGVKNYDEDDVLNSARILTGWSVDSYQTWSPTYRKENHFQGRVKVKGFKDKNKKSNGKATTARYLRYLAHHPDTAERIAHKLVLKFVGDQPSRSLVKRLAQVYRDNDTEIVPVLRALIESKQFRRSVGEKVRDPSEDVVATYRALGLRVDRPTGPENDGTAISVILGQAGRVGMMPYYWGSPDGQPLDNASWCTPGRALGSMQVHYGVAGGVWPRSGAKVRSAASWLPSEPARFDDTVDAIARRILHRPARRDLVQACSTAVGLAPDAALSSAQPDLPSVITRMLATVLDTPEFMSR